jgi:hypothetical protein
MGPSDKDSPMIAFIRSAQGLGFTAIKVGTEGDLPEGVTVEIMQSSA